MKVRNNYKIAIGLTLFAIVMSKIILPQYERWILISILPVATVSVIVAPLGEIIYNLISRVGKIIGNIISKTILIFVWFFAVLPTGVVMKIAKRDRLRLRKVEKQSYWIDNKEEVNYEYQF